MVVKGVNKITAVCLYLGVRAGGWWTWYGVGDKIASYCKDAKKRIKAKLRKI